MIVPLPNEEVSAALGGGIKHPSLVLLEGGHGSGKTVFSFGVVRGFLDNGMRVIFISTESTVSDVLDKMRSISYDADIDFAGGRLKIYSIYSKLLRTKIETTMVAMRILSRYLSLYEGTYDLVVIDSISPIISGVERIDGFIGDIKRIVDKGATILLTMYPQNDRNSRRLKGSADAYFTLEARKYAMMDVIVVKIVKLWGLSSKSSVLFIGVDEYGIRLWPLSEAFI